MALEDQWPLAIGPAAVPRALMLWLRDPVVDDELGARILREMAVTELVLGYNC